MIHVFSEWAAPHKLQYASQINGRRVKHAIKSRLDENGDEPCVVD